MCAAFFLFNTWNSSCDSSSDAVSSETLKETKQKISQDKKTMNVNMNIYSSILPTFVFSSRETFKDLISFSNCKVFSLTSSS